MSEQSSQSTGSADGLTATGSQITGDLASEKVDHHFTEQTRRLEKLDHALSEPLQDLEKVDYHFTERRIDVPKLDRGLAEPRGSHVSDLFAAFELDSAVIMPKRRRRGRPSTTVSQFQG
ncbi:MAG: hypothetical protein AAF560_32300 [Acidobacteriota bacterium]